MTDIVFFGSSSHSITILTQLIELHQFNLKLVVTKIDKPVGRNQRICANPVAKFASDHHFPLLQIENFDRDTVATIAKSQAKIGLCVAFGPPFFNIDTLNLFPLGIVNIHPSPLPKYRGAAPGPWQIINGETISAITFFKIDLLPDHGPIIAKIPLTINLDDTSETFYQQAFALASAQLESVLENYIKNPNLVIKQDHSQKSYFPKLSKNSGQVNWSKTTAEIERFVRAMQPWPIAWTNIVDKSGKMLTMKIFSFDTEPIRVQIEGKKPTNWTEIKPYYSLQK